MSISPSSDILLGVARAADPQKYRAAVEKLAQTTNASPAAEDFAAVAEQVASSKATPASSASATTNPQTSAAQRLAAKGSTPTAASAKHPDKAYVKFEAFFLRTVVESMLPKESSKFFGTGSAGEIWKSMLAEHVADALAQAGGVGIAAKLADHQAKMRKSVVPSTIPPLLAGARTAQAEKENVPAAAGGDAVMALAAASSSRA